MNARIICSVIGLVMAGTAWGQVEVEWERTYRLPGENTELMALVQTQDSGYVLAGIIGQNPGLLATDAREDSVWSRIYGGEDWFYGEATAIVPAQEAVWTLSIVLHQFEGPDYCLLGVNAQGDSLWSQLYSQEAYTYDVNSMIRTADGGLALAGAAWPTNDEDPDVFLLRLSSEGDTVWSQMFDIAEGEGEPEKDICYSMVETADGGFALAGSTTSDDETYFLWTLKTNNEGDSLWSVMIEGALEDISYHIVALEDGGTAVAGPAGDFRQGIIDYWLLRMNADGEVLWSQTYGGESMDICLSLTGTADNGFALLGLTTTIGAEGTWILKTDAEGDSVWSLILPGEPDFDASYRSILQSSDLSFVIAGGSSQWEDWEYWLAKTTPDPVSVPPDFQLSTFDFQLLPPFPNPFNSATRITFTSPINRGATRLLVFDPLGRRVAELTDGKWKMENGTAERHSVVWDAKGFPAGGYVIRLEAGAERVERTIILTK